MVKIKRHTAGDTRVADSVPTITEFKEANTSHISDVIQLMKIITDKLSYAAIRHDYTKTEEPFASLFYRDLCSTIEGGPDFEESEWYNLHCKVYERHHLNTDIPRDVNLIDVLEMICDCVASSAARTGEISDVDIPAEILMQAVDNTVRLLEANILIEE